MTNLASGVDAFYLSARVDVPGRTLDSLEAARERATVMDAPCPIDFGDGSARVLPHGWLKYRYCLEHPNGRIGVTKSKRLPGLYVQPKAEALHSIGPAGVAAWVAGIAGSECGGGMVSVSRIDLCSDWHGWTVTGDDRHRFVCRATKRNTYEESEALTGFTFGNRKAGTVLGRIYDKTLDIQHKGTDWWFDIWGDRYRTGEQVHRIEFEFSRSTLREFGLASPAETLDAVPALWSYATGDWLSLRDPSSDGTRSRWPVSPDWQQVQAIEFDGAVTSLERVLAGKSKGGLRRILPALNGYLVTFGAHLGAESIHDVLDALGGYVRDYEIISGVPFAERLRRRRAELYG
jgi:hypothetical protein